MQKYQKWKIHTNQNKLKPYFCIFHRRDNREETLGKMAFGRVWDRVTAAAIARKKSPDSSSTTTTVSKTSTKTVVPKKSSKKKKKSGKPIVGDASSKGIDDKIDVTMDKSLTTEEKEEHEAAKEVEEGVEETEAAKEQEER